MEVAVGARHLHFPVGQAAQTRRQRRQVGAQHARVAHQHDVGPQQVAVVRKEAFETGRTNLFLALENKLHVDAQQVVAHEIFESLDLYHRLALVVVGPAAPHGTVAHDGLEGSRRPGRKRLGRHHVVVAVDENGGSIGRDEALAIDNGVALGGHHLDPFGTGLVQQLCPAAGTALHIVVVLGLGADARNAQQTEPFAQEAGLVFVDVRFYIAHLVVD